jgi:hypothetical protein
VSRVSKGHCEKAGQAGLWEPSWAFLVGSSFAIKRTMNQLKEKVNFNVQMHPALHQCRNESCPFDIKGKFQEIP